MEIPVAGQRWVSNTEAELGLGVLLKADFGRLEIFFPAAGEMRQYAAKSAPLRRVKFKDGDTIKTHDGASYTVDSVDETAGLIIYKCGGTDISESQLADTISFSKPDDRLLAGQIDDIRTFNLRFEALKYRNEIQKNPVRGFVGARVDLLGHQLFIADEVSRRLKPRVLLADEVGLGKTIEAGLILHRLLLTGRAKRVLILVPEPLVNQWFVELLRRFNLVVGVYDETRCEDLASDDAEGNPFLANQVILCAVSFLANNPLRAQQCMAADWDLMIVDEAHHLEWTPEAPGATYQMVSDLAARIEGLILITATPQQLGREGHFARLRLLDPVRYDSLEKFTEEADHYEEVAQAVDRVLTGKALTAKDTALFSGKSDHVKRLLPKLKKGGEEVRAELTAALLDEFGTGRVMFRNTRAALTGFPEREAHLCEIAEGPEALVKWLAHLLQQHGDSKFLAICKTKEQALATQAALAREISVNSAVFHEDMTLMQRDRAAVHFADEEGARVLICSEIGSEGRNFQFAHHLALLDLPENPELLEQRIGRLDRIGQTSTIHLHVPYTPGTASEVLARWYHEGLNAFNLHPHGALEVLQQVGDELTAMLAKPNAKKLGALITKTAKAHASIGQKLERGQDRLLELNSFKPEAAAAVITAMRALDDDLDFEDFILRLMDRIGMVVEEHGDRSYVFRQGDLMADSLPNVPPEGLLVTFDRSRALSRDNIGFLTIDHPLVRGALDWFLGSEVGNTCFGIWKDSGEEGLAIEANFIVECVAPAAIHADRFLPLTPVRVIVDHVLNDLSDDEEATEAKLMKGDPSKFLDAGQFRKKLLPQMIKKANSVAAEKTASISQQAQALADQQLDAEIERLQDLAKINDHISEDEIGELKAQKFSLQSAISSARHRMDGIRLILRAK